MKRAEFIPHSELIADPELVQQQTDHRVDWELDLPQYAEPSRIGTNVAFLGRVARLSGIDQLTIGAYSGEQTSVEPEIVGYNGNGTAIAGGASVVTARRSTSEINGTAVTTARIDLNMAEIERDLSERRALREPAAWAKVIDGELRGQVRDVATDALLHHSDTKSFKEYARQLPGVVGGPPLGMLLADLAPDGTLEVSPGLCAAFSITAAVGITAAWKVKAVPPTDYEAWKDKKIPSILPGYHPDTALAINAVTRFKRMTKEV